MKRRSGLIALMLVVLMLLQSVAYATEADLNAGTPLADYTLGDYIEDQEAAALAASGEASAEPTYLEQIAALQAQAEALDPESETLEDELYTIYEAVYAVVDAATLEWEAGAMTDEEYEEVVVAAQGVWDYLKTEYGFDPYATDLEAEERNIKYYRGDVDVYWDEASATGTSATSKTGTSTNNIASVQLNGVDVLWGNSSLGSDWAGTPKQVEDYYTSASTTNDQSVVLSIVPKPGYYVTHITVACCPASATPYKCATWSSNYAYDTDLSVTASGVVTIDLSVVAFCHDNNNKEDDHQYFILIVTAPLPSPLLVEYDYGTIGEHITSAGGTLANTAFASPDNWTDDNTGNYYGSDTEGLKGVKTNDTQMKYVYASGDEEDAADWTHTTNTVTTAAKEDAAEVGYYFAGWEVQYYEECEEAAITNPTYNNYTYTFSEEYGSSFVTNENVSLQLVTNVKLVALWEPVTLNVTKTVSGMSTYSPAAMPTYTFQVYKQSGSEWVEYGDAFSLTLTSTEDYTYDVKTFSSVTAGVYKVVETSNGGNLESSDGSMIYYVAVSEDGSVTYTTAGIMDGTTRSATLNVTNTYSDEPATTSVTATKLWEDNDNAYNTRPENITLQLNADGSAYGDAVTVTPDENGNWTYTWSDLPISNGSTDYEYTVTERSVEGYDTEITGNASEGFVVTNTLQKIPIILVKEVTGNMGDRNKEFAFTITGAQDASGNAITSASLKHDESITLYVPYGSTLTFTETYGTYTPSYRVTKTVITTADDGTETTSDVTITDSDGTAMNGSAVGTVSILFDADLKEADKIIVTNTKQENVDTGVTLDTVPYLLLAAGAGLMMLAARRRRTDN